MCTDKYVLELEAKIAKMEQENIDLKNENERLQIYLKAFESSNNVQFIARMSDGVFVDLNDAGASSLGFTREELIGKNSFELSMSSEEIKLKIRSDIENGISIKNYPCKFRRISGEIGAGLACIEKMEVNGEKLHIISAVDVTERIKKEELFSKAFHQNQVPMSITRVVDGILIDANKKYADSMGYRREDIIGKSNYSELDICELSNEERNNALKQLNYTGFVENLELKFRRRNGEIGTAISSHTLIDLNGEWCRLTSAIDITDRKQAEEELIQSQRLWNKIFNSVPLPMTVRRLRDNRIIEVNDAYLSRYNLNRYDFLKLRDSEIDLLPLNSYMDDCIQIIKEKGFLKNYEATYQLPTGNNITVLMSGVLVLWEGEQCVLSISNDITELRAYEDEIKRLDNLNLMGKMAGSIAHEIRNPMTSIKGFLQLFQQEDKYREDKEPIGLMIEELDRVNEMISQFLSLAHKNIIELKVASLNRKIEQLLPLIMADAVKNDVYVQTDLGEIPGIMLDKGQFRSLLLNLSHNGIQAMPNGGTLTIKSFQDDSGIQLVVQDEGKGIPPEVIEKIGTPFFTTRNEGTGLGLAVCYSIAERHNAKLSFDTSPEGTSFKVTFPVVA